MGRTVHDLSERRFANWTVLCTAFPARNKKDQPVWDCICTCGNTETLTSHSLRAAERRTYGGCKLCKEKSNVPLLAVGSVVGNWTVLCESPKHKNATATVWECLCRVCGEISCIAHYILARPSQYKSPCSVCDTRHTPAATITFSSTDIRNMTGPIVYVMYEGDTCRYAGVSRNGLCRVFDISHKHYGTLLESSRVEIQVYESEEAALAAERYLIRTLHPTDNEIINKMNGISIKTAKMLSLFILFFPRKYVA